MKKAVSIIILVLMLSTTVCADTEVWQEGVLESGLRYVANTILFDLSFKDDSSSIAKLIGDGELKLVIFEDGRFAIVVYESNGKPTFNTSDKALSCKVYIRDGDSENEYYCEGVQEVNTDFQLYTGDLIGCIREMEKPYLFYKYSLGFTDTTVEAEQTCRILNLEDLLAAYDYMMESSTDSIAA